MACNFELKAKRERNAWAGIMSFMVILVLPNRRPSSQMDVITTAHYLESYFLLSQTVTSCLEVPLRFDY